MEVWPFIQWIDETNMIFFKKVILKKTIHGVEIASKIAIAIAFMVLIAAVMIQVIGRSVIGNSPVWTEELTRFSLLFLAAFGAGLSYRSGALVNVDTVCESLPGRWPFILRLFSAIATALLCIMLLAPAWRFASIGALQTSPALGWRMDFIMISIFILLASLAFFAIIRIIEMFAESSDGLPLKGDNQ